MFSINLAMPLEKTGLAPYLLSVPGVGVVSAATFLGEVGDLSRYEDWRQLRKLAGYNLTENTSGERSRSRTPISKRGRPGLRHVLYQKGKQALVALACKLLRVLFTLVKKQCTYDPAKALGAWRAEQLGIAA